MRRAEMGRQRDEEARARARAAFELEQDVLQASITHDVSLWPALALVALARTQRSALPPQVQPVYDKAAAHWSTPSNGVTEDLEPLAAFCWTYLQERDETHPMDSATAAVRRLLCSLPRVGGDLQEFQLTLGFLAELGASDR